MKGLEYAGLSFDLCTLFFGLWTTVFGLEARKGRRPKTKNQEQAQLLFVAELVANAPDGEHHLRILGVLFDLGSQAIDM